MKERGHTDLVGVFTAFRDSISRRFGRDTVSSRGPAFFRWWDAFLTPSLANARYIRMLEPSMLCLAFSFPKDMLIRGVLSCDRCCDVIF